MLTVLKFKKSLFAGVLDGGEKDVFMGGTRLTKFMESVEEATAAIPAAMVEEPEEAVPEEPPADQRSGTRRGKPGPAPAAETEPEEEPRPPVAAAVDPWTGLLQAGMALLQQFASGARPGTPGSPGQGSTTPSLGSLVQRDEKTGETFVKFPMPPPEVLDTALQAIGTLLQSLRR